MDDLVARWAGTAFQREAAAWADEVLGPRGLVRSGPLVPEKIRFWSAVFGVPLAGSPSGAGVGASGGRSRAWFKVGNPGQAFEGRLLQALGQVVPDRVVAPWAVDGERGWWLLPDGGPTLDGSRPEDWVDLLGDVADLQRACGPHHDRFDMVPALSTEAAAGWVDGTVDQLARLPAADPQHLDPARARSLVGGGPGGHDGLRRFGERMKVLAGTGLPQTLQPNDAHPRNAVGPSSPGAPARVFDLGDSVRSHPWAVLHTTVRLAARVPLTDRWPDTPLTRRIVEAYLERWPEVDLGAGPGSGSSGAGGWPGAGAWPGDGGLPEVLEAADRLGAVHRAASWLRLLAPVDPDRLAVPTPRVADWLELALR